MKSKGKKKEELDALKKELGEVKNLFVAQFQGMTVAQDTDLRQKIRDSKSKYRVVKNTLARKAAEGTPVEGVAKSFDGSTAIAYNAKDPVSLAKALTAYAKTNPLFVFKAGIGDGDALSRCIDQKEQLCNELFLRRHRCNVGDIGKINDVYFDDSCLEDEQWIGFCVSR